MNVNIQHYQNKTILLTGHTGFKGSWLSIWLREMGATVVGYAHDPLTPRDNFVLSGLTDKMVDIRGDIRDREHLRAVFRKYQPDMVFHLAAQPLVRYSYEHPVDTYEINVMGTMNVLEAMRSLSKPCTGIFVTTDKCYENKEQIWGYRESDPMGGYDPYSSSKGCMELLVSSYRNSFFNIEQYEKHQKVIATVRAGNVIGGGDWSLDRIVPDCIRAIEAGADIEVRSPKAIRPWQHVLEPLRGYLMLAEKLIEDPVKYSGSWNFGPLPESIISVKEVVERMICSYGKGQFRDMSGGVHLHEANLLLLDISKAMYELGWKPRLTMKETIDLTVDWYKRYQKESVYDLCVRQLTIQEGRMTDRITN